MLPVFLILSNNTPSDSLTLVFRLIFCSHVFLFFGLETFNVLHFQLLVFACFIFADIFILFASKLFGFSIVCRTLFSVTFLHGEQTFCSLRTFWYGSTLILFFSPDSSYCRCLFTFQLHFCLLVRLCLSTHLVYLFYLIV